MEGVRAVLYSIYLFPVSVPKTVQHTCVLCIRHIFIYSISALPAVDVNSWLCTFKHLSQCYVGICLSLFFILFSAATNSTRHYNFITTYCVGPQQGPLGDAG